jgi:hypothetical protein
VKNQYFGDINDYWKYGLLRRFVAAGLAPHVCWMLTRDTPSNGDGNKTRYLSRPHEWRAYDPELFDFLAEQIVNGKRSVECLEENRLLGPASFHRAELGDLAAPRHAYMADARHGIPPDALLFFDPDNGIEVPSVPYGRRGSSKYLYWHEVSDAWTTGASLCIFQHFTRESRRSLIDRLLATLRERTPGSAVGAILTAHVAFLFASQPCHHDSFAEAERFIQSRWAARVQVVRAGASMA